MSITLTQIRQESGDLLVGRPRFLIGTATGGSQQYLEDTLGLKNEARGAWYQDGWLLRSSLDSSDRLRQVLEDDSDNGRANVTPDYTVVPLVGEAYEIWPFGYDPVTVEKAIGRAMTRLRIPEQIDITGVSGQRQYDLSSYSWLTSPEQFLGLYLQDGPSLQQLGYQIPNVGVSQDEGTLTLNLDGPTFGSGDTLRLLAWRSALSTASSAAFASSSDTVLLPNDPEVIEYAALRTCEGLLERPYARRFGPRTDSQRTAALADIREQLRRFRTRFGQPRSWSLYSADPTTWGPGAIW